MWENMWENEDSIGIGGSVSYNVNTNKISVGNNISTYDGDVTTVDIIDSKKQEIFEDLLSEKFDLTEDELRNILEEYCPERLI